MPKMDSIDNLVHKLVIHAYEHGMIDPKAGAINLQVQVQVQFLASELLELGEIDEETHQKICQRVETIYPTTAKPRVKKKPTQL